MRPKDKEHVKLFPLKSAPGTNTAEPSAGLAGSRVFILGSHPFSAYKARLSRPPPLSRAQTHFLLTAFTSRENLQLAFHPKRGSVPIGISNRVYPLLYQGCCSWGVQRGQETCCGPPSSLSHACESPLFVSQLPRFARQGCFSSWQGTRCRASSQGPNYLAKGEKENPNPFYNRTRVKEGIKGPAVLVEENIRWEIVPSSGITGNCHAYPERFHLIKLEVIRTFCAGKHTGRACILYREPIPFVFKHLGGWGYNPSGIAPS